jgi:SAM-dependent methyltransferase
MAGADLTDLYEAKAVHYARFGNGVAAAAARRLLPAGGSVLDIGCATGGLLALLRPQAGFTAGIELSPSAAAEAAKVADRVVAGGVQDAAFDPASFDVVVLADVLEHLVDPGAALALAVGWTKPGGHVVVSVPNIAHWQARLAVARGQWRADDSGTFDATHLRFFTVERVRALVEGAGLDDVAVEPVVPRLRNHVGVVERLPGRVGEAIERGWQAAGRRRPNLLGYQLVATGRRSTRASPAAQAASATSSSGT